jgi:hypothetical protein
MFKYDWIFPGSTGFINWLFIGVPGNSAFKKKHCQLMNMRHTVSLEAAFAIDDSQIHANFYTPLSSSAAG